MKTPAFAILAALVLWTTIVRAESTPQQIAAEAAKYQAGQSLEHFRKIEQLLQRSISDSKLRAEVETALVSMLEPGSTSEARLFACKQLGILGGNRSASALGKLLENPDTAGHACLALTTYPPGKADQVLREALSRAQGTSLIQVINTLGDRRDSKSVKPLLQIAKTSGQPVSAAAIASLGKIGTRNAAEALEALENRPAVTEATLVCADRLAASGERKLAAQLFEPLLAASNQPYIRRSAFSGLLRLDKDAGEERISKILNGSDAVLRPVAIAAVRSLPGQDASDKFGRAVSPQSPPFTLSIQEQVWMIDSLAARADAAARRALNNGLSAPDAAVRLAAISALGRIGNQETVAPLVTLLDTKSAEERRALESALVSLQGRQATDTALLASLEKSSGDARVLLINVLARRQAGAANPTLLREARSDPPPVATAALRNLSRTATAQEAPELVRLVAITENPQVRAEAESAAVQALARLEDVSKRSFMVCNQLKVSSRIENRASLLGLLPGCPDAAALATLKKATTDPDPAIREAGTRALAEWPNDAAWQDLIGIWCGADTALLRGITLRGLVRIASAESGQESVVSRYKELLGAAKGDNELKLILGAIGGAHFPATLELALPLLSNTGVRNEAKVAIKQIAEAIKAKHPEAAKAALEAIAR